MIRNDTYFDFIDLGDGTGALMGKDSNATFFMNQTAWCLWNILEANYTRDALIREFFEKVIPMEMNEETKKEVNDFIDQMLAEGIISDE